MDRYPTFYGVPRHTLTLKWLSTVHWKATGRYGREVTLDRDFAEKTHLPQVVGIRKLEA